MAPAFDADSLLALATSFNVEVFQRPNGHWQLRGALLVNWYPLSRHRTAYVNGATVGEPNVDAERAVRLATGLCDLSVPLTARKDGQWSIRTKRRLSKHSDGLCHRCRQSFDENSATRRKSLDHVVPLSRGGSNRDDNLVLACVGCNRKRGNELPSTPRLAKRSRKTDDECPF